jgi:hypothetical protein
LPLSQLPDAVALSEYRPHMMPPTSPRPAPTGDIAPDPNEVLALGGLRWLTQDGQVLTTDEPGGGTRASLTLSLNPSADLDMELAPVGYSVRITQATAAYWEAAARRGGYSLTSLLDEPPQRMGLSRWSTAWK